jgi:hypothetical protein
LCRRGGALDTVALEILFAMALKAVPVVVFWHAIVPELQMVGSVEEITLQEFMMVL